MVLENSAGFSVEKMAIFGKYLLSSLGMKPWKASMVLGINPRLLLEILTTIKRITDAIVHVSTASILTTLFNIFWQVNELLKKQKEAVPTAFPSVFLRGQKANVCI